MPIPPSIALAHGRSDSQGQLVSASDRLSALQLECGGDLPGSIAIPALRELERKARLLGLKLARTMRASTGHESITAWVEIEPEANGGTAMRFASWEAVPLVPDNPDLIAQHRAAIERDLAELVAQLDEKQGVLAVQCDADDLVELCAAMQASLGSPWTDFVVIEGASQNQPLHWRLLDGVMVKVPGSHRQWRASLLPQRMGGNGSAWFELRLSAEAPLVDQAGDEVTQPANGPGLLGPDIAPALREPIVRIIRNARTIRMRMAGPLAEEYAHYAADMVSAGEHLLALVDDFSDLEVIEADDFETAAEHVDLGAAVQRAVTMLLARAQEKAIAIQVPRIGESLPAVGEFRRVLQILLNLIGNAIRYSPRRSRVSVHLERVGALARVIVVDQGPGLSPDQQVLAFDKFERLGRSSDDGGTGLGLYISRRLARAMGGDLTVESTVGEGARFTLTIPAAISG